LLERVERHLRALLTMGFLLLGESIPPEQRAAWEAEAGEEVAPLSYRWLGDLLQFTDWELEAAEEAKLRARIGATNGRGS
jgi:hypothetical protein